MGGFFGVAATGDCVSDLFFGTDYHSHLGTRRGGMATLDTRGFTRFIHNIENAQFRSKFQDDLVKMRGATGIGVISDYEDQPLIIGSHLGTYAIVTVGLLRNLESLAEDAFGKRMHFSEMVLGEVNPTEVVASLIDRGSTFAEGIRIAQEAIEGSCSMLVLTREGIYAARDRLGRTPVVLGERPGACAASMETCAFPNLGYRVTRYMGPGGDRPFDGVRGPPAQSPPRGDADMRLSLGLLRLSRLQLRGDQRGGGPQPVRRGPGPEGRRGGGHGGRDPGFWDRPCPGLRLVRWNPLQEAVRQVHAHMAP
jgi:hypothetical protein